MDDKTTCLVHRSDVDTCGCQFDPVDPTVKYLTENGKTHEGYFLMLTCSECGYDPDKRASTPAQQTMCQVEGGIEVQCPSCEHTWLAMRRVTVQ